jgi:hypothetical protein
MSVSCAKTYKISLTGILILLAGLQGCTSVNTFPMIARAGDTISVMVGGSEKARKDTISVSLTDANNQTWDLRSSGLVRSVFNLRTDGRAHGLHYSSYSSGFMPWVFGHEPLQTVLVTDLPPGVAPGRASLSVVLNTDDNSSGIGSPFTVNLEIIGGTGSTDGFLRQNPFGSDVAVDFESLEPAPHAKISFGMGTQVIGAVSLVVDFNETAINPDDINVYVPESAVRNTSVTNAFGKTQRMVYWRQDGQRLYIDVVAPQGIELIYSKIYIIHRRSSGGASPNFSLISASVYDVNGSVLAIQPILEYFP